MQTYETTFHGLPVTVNYMTDMGEIDIWSVEWRGIELQDAINADEAASIEGEMYANLQADLNDAADYALQASIEERAERKAA